MTNRGHGQGLRTTLHAVHNALGAGFLEKAYKDALRLELAAEA